VLSTLLSSIVGLLLLATIWFIPLGAWLHISELSAADTRLITVLLGISALFGMQETLFQGAFRCVGKYAFGALTKSLITSTAFCGIMVLVALGRSPSQVAIGFLILNALGTVVLWILLRRKVDWLHLGIRHAHWRIIQRLFSPGVSFLSIPIGNAISLQGVLLVIGQVMGPIAVVTYSTARTLSRTALQAMNLINDSVWPEVSTAFGAGDLSLARRLHRRACQLSVLLCIGTIAGGIFMGPYIWQKWTMGAIPTDRVLLNILFIQLFFASFWYSSSVILVATNRHQGFAKVFLATTCFSLFLTWLASGYFHMGLRGVAGAMVVGEIITSLYVFPASLKLVEDNLVDFLSSMLHFPRLELSRRFKSKRV
jgi:O-antigen/teichoic acid export membrane protein